MSKTAARTKRTHGPVVADDLPREKPRGQPDWSPTTVLKALASLRLTVALFALAIILIFCGTLAQIDAGIWTVVNKYFRSAYVWVPLQIFFPRTLNIPGGFPFPGGWLIGGLLLANLVAAHAVRFKVSWKRSGILLIHSGLIVMMVSEFVTGVFAVEANMTIEQGKSSNFVERRDSPELAIVDSSDPKEDDVVVIPKSVLRRGGTIHNDLLPFDVEVVRYMVNSADPLKTKPGRDNPATAGDGLRMGTADRPEITGTEPEQKVDLASAYVTLKKKGTGETLGTYLVSLWFSIRDMPQLVTVDGKTYEVSLRFQRDYKPYTIHLNKFSHDLYPGTDKPKNFSSDVRVVDPERNEDRKVQISMNAPLRYRGETFYQSSFLEGDRGTILQVVHNPGWPMPYISCGMVAAGMLVHFLIHLVGFLRLRVAV